MGDTQQGSTQNNWYSTGYDGLNEESTRLSGPYPPDRLWMPKATTREIVFVDAIPFTFKEHQYKHNGSWRNQVTCNQVILEPGESPECDRLIGEPPHFMGMYTVIDTSKWTDKKGNSRQYEVKELAARYTTLKKLQRVAGETEEHSKLPSFAGRLYRATRDTEKDPGTGNEFKFIRDVDSHKLFDLAMYKGVRLSDLYAKADADASEFSKLAQVFQIVKGVDGRIERRFFPFAYQKIHAPKTNAELRKILAGYVREPDAQAAAGKADEEIPF